MCHPVPIPFILGDIAAGEAQETVRGQEEGGQVAARSQDQHRGQGHDRVVVSKSVCTVATGFCQVVRYNVKSVMRYYSC